MDCRVKPGNDGRGAASANVDARGDFLYSLKS